MASPAYSETLGGTQEAGEFGAALRDMRLAHNADISTVASTLRIRQVYLQAIEEGRFGDLPGPTYAAGFVRAYAEYLGLEIPEVMRRYREVTRDGAAQARLVAPSPVTEGRMPTGFILLVAAVLAGIAYGSWYYLTLNGRDASDLVAQLPQRIADIVGLDRSTGETPTPSTATMPEVSAKTPAETSPESPVEPVVAERETPVPEEAQAEPAVQTAEPAPPEPTPLSEATAQGAEAAVEPAAVAAAPEPAASAPEGDQSALVPVSEAPSPSPNAVVTVPLPSATEAGDSVVPPATMVETAPAAGGDSAEVTSGPGVPGPAAVMTTPAASAPGPAEQVAAVPPAAPATPPAEAAGRVVLRATAISWVELRDSAGKRVFSRLLKKGETYNVPARPGITLATGNAGALDILVDGREITAIGPLGAVRRDVLLEPDALLARGTPGQ